MRKKPVRPKYKIPPGSESYYFVNPNKLKPVQIDSTKPFEMKLNLTAYVTGIRDGYCCSVCGEMLVRVEPNGILGQELNKLDMAVILNHHLAKHNP